MGKRALSKNTKLTPEELSDKVLVAAIDAFLRVRRLAMGNTQKPPSTSELIDWVQILHWNGATVDSLNTDPNRPPHWGILFKTMGDLDIYDSLSKSDSTKAVS